MRMLIQILFLLINWKKLKLTKRLVKKKHSDAPNKYPPSYSYNPDNKSKYGGVKVETVKSPKLVDAETMLMQKSKALRDLELKWSEIVSGNFFYDFLSEPVKSTKTDSNGRFKLTIPNDIEIVIAAYTNRSVVEKKDKYYWMVPVYKNVSGNIDITLSNDNMTSVDGGSLFFSID